MPTLGVCLGAQLLATAHAGLVERSPSGPEIGPGAGRPARRRRQRPAVPLRAAAAGRAPVALRRDHRAAAGAVLLAASTRYPHQAFRLGDRAWGLQFHIECDADMIADWARATTGPARRAGLRRRSWWWPPATGVLADVEEVWQPFAVRFAALALGELPDADTRPAACPCSATELSRPTR